MIEKKFDFQGIQTGLEQDPELKLGAQVRLSEDQVLNLELTTPAYETSPDQHYLKVEIWDKNGKDIFIDSYIFESNGDFGYHEHRRCTHKEKWVYQHPDTETITEDNRALIKQILESCPKSTKLACHPAFLGLRMNLPRKEPET